MKTFLAGGFAERGTEKYIESYEHARLEAGMRRRLMAFGRKNQEKYVEIFKTKVFLAGNTGPLWRERACLEDGLRRRLYSYSRKRELVDRLGMYEAEGDRFELMLDSGAFSAHSRNLKIDIDEYAAFILKHSAALKVVVNLDVIPGTPGTKKLNTDPQKAERAAAEGWENWQYLTKKLAPTGITP